MYSDELIKEVKEVYPNNHKMHELAENGDVYLGRYVENTGGGFSADQILTAYSLDKLKEEALVMKRKENIWRMWCKEDAKK